MPGLNDFVAEDGTALHPPVAPVFWSFRVMVGTGVAMLALSWAASLLIWRRGVDGLPRRCSGRWCRWPSRAGSPRWRAGTPPRSAASPGSCNGVLTTEQAVSGVPAAMVATTLVAYLVIYAVLLAAYVGVLFYLARKAAKGDTVPTRVSAGEMATAQTLPAE